LALARTGFAHLVRRRPPSGFCGPEDDGKESRKNKHLMPFLVVSQLTAAATPKAVSQALGHESLTTTYRHYADQGIAQQHEHQRAVDSLAPPSFVHPN
jgi:hypothetical protein